MPFRLAMPQYKRFAVLSVPSFYDIMPYIFYFVDLMEFQPPLFYLVDSKATKRKSTQLNQSGAFAISIG